MNLTENLIQEAQAFDEQINARMANGHVPDLRLCTPCDWFYNNPWRRPAYVQLDFGEQFELIRAALHEHGPRGAQALKILEVGCGPGYLSLELARAGFDVTGLDLSPRCIEIANQVAQSDPYAYGRGPLRYVAGDFFADPTLVAESFDAVIFLGALHHFPDQSATLDRTSTLLRPDGLVLAHEPVRDRVTRGNAAFAHLLRVVLSAGGGYFKAYPVPATDADRQDQITSLFNAMRYETEEGEKAQSVNDNEAGYAEMRPALDARFVERVFNWRYAFFHEFIGGLRFEESKNESLARYLRDMDGELCRLGVLSATEFFFVGQKR